MNELKTNGNEVLERGYVVISEWIIDTIGAIENNKRLTRRVFIIRRVLSRVVEVTGDMSYLVVTLDLPPRRPILPIQRHFFLHILSPFVATTLKGCVDEYTRYHNPWYRVVEIERIIR
jgi:hypothetical protein